MSSNSIYEYYQRVSDRYYLASAVETKGVKSIKHLWNPLATCAPVPDFAEFDFFLNLNDRYLSLCEGLTGAVIINQRDMPTRQLRSCNRKEFLQAASRFMKQKGGAKEINVLIVNFLCDSEQQISPRYQAKKV